MSFISNFARWDGDPKVLRSGPSSLGSSDRMARGLGWLSLGLGMTELLAPRRITRALGMEGREGLLRFYGAREIASGVLTLSTEQKLGLRSRIAGDGVDIATLLTAMRHENPKRGNVGLALAMVLGVTLLDMIAAEAVHARHRRDKGRQRSYRDRSGFPRGVQQARGAARHSTIPADMRTPPALAHLQESSGPESI